VAVVTRRVYISLAFTTILVGLLVHLHGLGLGAIAKDVVGDALYAAMIVWWIGAIAPRWSLALRAASAFVLCAIIETSQLFHTPMIDAVRATRLGHLVLGSGFDARDLVAYAVGVAAAALIDFQLNRKRS
jgi:hypothetical protein